MFHREETSCDDEASMRGDGNWFAADCSMGMGCVVVI
jgi:hypothetical protein